MHKVLIISFFFPPSPSIGGRRWAYLGKALYEKNIDVHVIASDMGTGNCPWGDTIKNFKSNIKIYPSNIPFYLRNKTPNTISDKLLYKMTLLKDKVFRPASTYDLSANFANDIYKCVEDVINSHQIRNIIVTGGPFYLPYRFSSLKVKYGDKINFIIDLRDPWTEHREINSKIRKKKRLEQDIAMDLADTIFVPDIGMVNNLSRVYPKSKQKVKLLPHGYDEEIFKTKATKGNFNKWYYAGTIYPKLNLEFSLLNEIIEKLNVNVDFYIFKNDILYDTLNTPRISINGLLTQDELYKATTCCGITLFITRFKDYKSTKFYEIIKSGTFILYIGKKGELSSYLGLNKIGYAIETDNALDINIICTELKKSFEEFEPKPHLADGYSFTELAKIVEDELR